jgi:hypothetical protein
MIQCIDSIALLILIYLDRLDGLYQRRTPSLNSSSSPMIEKRVNNTTMFVDEQPSDSSSSISSKKKKVRWADVEENSLHLHKKAGRYPTIDMHDYMYIGISVVSL